MNVQQLFYIVGDGMVWDAEMFHPDVDGRTAALTKATSDGVPVVYLASKCRMNMYVGAPVWGEHHLIDAIDVASGESVPLDAAADAALARHIDGNRAGTWTVIL